MVSARRPTGYNASEALKRLTQTPSIQPHVGTRFGHQPVQLHGFSKLKDTRYKGYSDAEIEKKTGLKNETSKGDMSRKLQYLMKQAEYYNKNLNSLRKYSVSQLREAEGMYPELGQYDKIENSGWVKSKPTSLKELDGLSTADRIALGMKDRATGKHDLAANMYHEHHALRSSMEKFNEGGLVGPRERLIDRFNKKIIGYLKDYTELQRLKGGGNDAISKLALTQMENIYNRMDYLTDDKKLQELTGVDLWENGIRDKYYIKRLLPTPLDATGKKATWFLRPDHELGRALQSDFFAYIAPHLLDSPLRYYMDKSTKKLERPHQDFLQPYRGISKLAQDTLIGHQQRMSDFVKMNPEVLDKKMRGDFLENFKIFGKGNKPLPIGVSGLTNITNQRGDASGGLHEYRPFGMDMIEYYSRGKDHKPMDYKPFLQQLYASQQNNQLPSSSSPQPFRPNLPLPGQEDLLKKHYRSLMGSTPY
ncbi:MAG: hypothetical protein AAF621_03205 [Pseudomonadota bacterium]